MKTIYRFIFSFILTSCIFCADAQDFVKRQGATFNIKGLPFKFVGTNYWYGGLLCNTAKGKERAKKELDFLKKNGVTVLRILAGAEGSGLVNGIERVGPPLQPAKAKFDMENLKGLDYLLVEMGKRNMKAVLFLSNNWEWSGGFLQYLNWAGELPDTLMRRKLNWDEMRDIVSGFYTCNDCMESYQNQARFVISRTNTVSKKQYRNDPTIMAWELANEPRPMRPSAIGAYQKWVGDAAAFIKKTDQNHLVTTGSEGEMGSENMSVFSQIHAQKNIDYATIHIWPKNWGWFSDTAIAKGFGNVVSKTNKYISDHISAMQLIDKPLVIEEFGLPRDKQSFSVQSPTTYRDKYYGEVFKYLTVQKDGLPGVNGIMFWAFGGSGRPANPDNFWKKGDDLLGDPPMEEQGLNTVFDTDKTTWTLINSVTATLNKKK